VEKATEANPSEEQQDPATSLREAFASGLEAFKFFYFDEKDDKYEVFKFR
jgi:hypothetical protein